MDLEIISFMALIIMANGKPLNVNLDPKSPQAEFQSSSIVVSSGPSKVSETHQSSSIISSDFVPEQAFQAQMFSTTGVSSNSATGQVIHSKYHSTSSNQQSSRNPSAVVTSSFINEQNPYNFVTSGNPIVGEFMNIECNPSFSLIVKDQTDPVQSDFSASRIADVPEVENISSDSENNMFHPYSTSNLYDSNKVSSLITVNGRSPHTVIITAKPMTKNKHDPSANNNFNSVAQDQDDPVQSDFSLSKISEVPPTGQISAMISGTPYQGPVIVSSSVTTKKPLTSNNSKVESNNFIDMVNTLVEEKVAVSSTPVNDKKPIVVTTMTTEIENNSSSSVNKQHPVTIGATNNSASETLGQKQDQYPATTNVFQEEHEPSTNISVSNSSANVQQPIIADSLTNSATEKVDISNQPGKLQHKASEKNSSSITTEEEPVTIVTADNHIRDTLNATQNKQVNVPEQPTGSQISSEGISAINEQEPVTIVTAISPVKGSVDPLQNQLSNMPNAPKKNLILSGPISASSTSVGGQEPITIVWANYPKGGQLQNHISNLTKKSTEGQETLAGVSVSSASANGQEPITVVTAVNSNSDQTENQKVAMLNKPLEGQTSSAEISVSSNSVNGQTPVIAAWTSNTSSNTVNNFTGGQVSSSGNSVSNNFVDEQNPVTVATAIKPVTRSVNQIQNQQASVPNESTGGQMSSTGSSVSSTSTNEQIPVAVAAANNSVGGSQIQTQLINITSKSVGREASSATNTVSSSLLNEQKPVTVTTTSNSMVGSSDQMQNMNNMENKPVVSSGGFSVSGSSVNEQKPTTAFIDSNAHTGFLNQLQNQFVNMGNRPIGGNIFPSFSGGFFNQQNPTTALTGNNPSMGIFNQIKDQFAINTANKPSGQQVSVGSSIVSSSSSDGQKTQTIVTSTDNLTGKVTQTKYESSAGKPVSAFQSISTSSDGNKSQTIITSKNPITGEVSQTKYESSSVRTLPEESALTSNTSSKENVGASIARTSNSTNDEIIQVRIAPSSTNDNNNDKGRVMGEITGSSAALNGDSVQTENISRRSAKSLQKDMDNSEVPNNPTDGQISSGIVISTSSINGNNVTIITTGNSALGAYTQTKYVTRPAYLVDKSPEATTSVNDQTTESSAKLSTEQVTRTKFGPFSSPLEEATVSNSFVDGQNSQAVLNSTNSSTGKVTQSKDESSRVNVNNQKFSSIGIYPPAKPVQRKGEGSFPK